MTSSDSGGACSVVCELGSMAPAASINNVACDRIGLQGFAVALLLWFSCLLAGVESKGVNLPKEESTSIFPFRGSRWHARNSMSWIRLRSLTTYWIHLPH